MNSKIFTHFMNRVDDLGERIAMLQHDLDKLREDLDRERRVKQE